MTDIGRKFVPQSTIDRRVQAKDDRYARELRARQAIPSFLRPEVVAFASIEVVTARLTDSAPVVDAPTLAPARHRDLTPAMGQQVCVCGIRFPHHFDGWDGNRLDCTEARRRAGIVAAPPPVVCAWCPEFNPRDVRNQGVSHGMCPTCVARLEEAERLDREDAERDERCGSTCGTACSFCGACS